jgi:plasmid stabilization system protein ParE
MELKSGLPMQHDHERAIWRSCLRLVCHPHLGKSRDELLVGIRSVLIDPHVVFYTVSPNTIEIVRVIHQREDTESIFS